MSQRGAAELTKGLERLRQLGLVAVAPPSLEIPKSRWVTVLDKQLLVTYLSGWLNQMTSEVPSHLNQPSVVQE